MIHNVITQEAFQDLIKAGARLSFYDVTLNSPLLFTSNVSISNCIFRFDRSFLNSQAIDIFDVSAFSLCDCVIYCNNAGEGIHGIRLSGSLNNVNIFSNLIIKPSGYGIGVQYLMNHSELGIADNQIFQAGRDGIDIKQDLQEEPLLLTGNKVYSYGMNGPGVGIDCRGLVEVSLGAIHGSGRSKEKYGIRFRNENPNKKSGPVLYPGQGSVQLVEFTGMPSKKRVHVEGKPQDRVRITGLW